ncbi:hypothetical protein CES85_1693 [Ochrobactrum quorumnocens]|uniref:Uncharacterized protein n=1 Tax=Ochrobactrum quorumnocens TaxID=271865 RepID=A0A248UKW3_9HYPH|nr:hypothetical protein CES85_1693 [[Ochrobactrum] quorumnocens]
MSHERTHEVIQLDASSGWLKPRFFVVAISETTNVIMIERMKGITIDA